MALNFADLIGLWTRPLPDGDAAFERFLEFYTDPIAVNGTLMPLRGLVDRARATQRTFSELEGELLAQADAPTHTTIVFRMRGRHVGAWPTPLGELPATGKVVERQVIDLLRIDAGRVSEIWMVSDELGALSRIGALSLAS